MDNDVQKLINEMVEGYFQSPTKPAFRIYNKTLCPDLWDANQHLDPEVRQHLLKMAYDFYEKTDFKAPILDVYFMGSSANYNWTPDSDVDVHVLIDLKQLQMPEGTAESATHAASSLWNVEHEVLVKGHTVEMNIQPLEDTKPHVTGIYSLVKDLWVRKPVHQNLNVDKPSILKKYNAMKQYIDASIATGDRDTMKGSKSYVDALRQYGLDTAGELGTENIVFKLLRARGIIKKLKDSITATYDKEMTVTEADNEIGKDYLGTTFMGSVRAVPVKSAAHCTHQDYDMISGINSQNWRYYHDRNQVSWNEQPDPKDVVKVDDFLAKRGIVNPRHRNRYDRGAGFDTIREVNENDIVVGNMDDEHTVHNISINGSHPRSGMKRWRHKIGTNIVFWWKESGEPSVIDKEALDLYLQKHFNVDGQLKHQMFGDYDEMTLIMHDPERSLPSQYYNRSKGKVRSFAEGFADALIFNGTYYPFSAEETVGPFMIFLDENKKPHWMFLVNLTADYYLDGVRYTTGGGGANNTHLNMVNRIQPKFPQVMFTRQGSEMVMGRTWKIDNNVYFVCWNDDLVSSKIPNVFRYLDLIFSAQCGVRDPKRIFYQTDDGRSIPYKQFKEHGVPPAPSSEPEEPIHSPEPEVSVDMGPTPPSSIHLSKSDMEPKDSEFGFKDIHTMSAAEKKRELAKMGAVPKVPEVPDWQKKRMAGIDELVNEIADKTFEVTMKQVGAVHPKPFAPQLPNQKLDFSKMTLANIKSLRDKAGREWEYCRKHEDRDGCERASIKFSELHSELKRRLAYINKPVMNEAKTDSRRGAIFLANKFGAKLDFDGGDSDIMVEAPKGCVWLADGTHELVASPWTEETTNPDTGVVSGKKTSSKELWDDIYQRMSYGIEKCTTPDCEWCNSVDETVAHSFETHYHGGDDYVEVFRNPTPKEFKACQPSYEVGALLYGRDIYTFNRQKAYHKNVMTQMKMPDALSLLLIPDNTNSNRFDIMVTDATKGTQWHHNPKTAGFIEHHPFFRGKQIDHIMYWDEDVVGDWADPKNIHLEEGYGTGIPEDDRLHIPDHRWQIRSKDAPKTPKMKTEEMTEIIDEVLNRIFQPKT